MLTRTKNITKRYSRSAALIVVYVLHLVFFQALMVSPVSAAATDVKPLFSYTNKAPISHPVKHPAVSYYTVMVKQGIIGLRSCCEVLTPYLTPANLLALHFNSLAVENGLQAMPQTLAHISQDNLKLYRVLHTFLI